MLNFKNTYFVTSAPKIENLPPESGIEIAFIGRSNAGKSSALNAITDHKNLAKTSKTPGRTQLINLFEVEEGKKIVDLPGYGFAKVPDEVKNRWQRSLTEYLQKRKCLRAVVLLMDIRHPLKDLDRQIITWASLANLEMLILLTKADKLKVNELKATLQQVKRSMVEFGCSYKMVPFSSLSKKGVPEVREILSQMYENFHETVSSEDTEVQDNEEDSDLPINEDAWNNWEK